MPGPEWINDEPGDRDDSPPMIGPVVALAVKPVAKFDQAHAQPTEPAMAHDPTNSEQEESGSTETPAPPRNALGTLLKLLALLKKIPLPSVGSERHEMLPPLKKSHSEPNPTATEPQSKPRAFSRFSLLQQKRETRVGIAILFSFVLLVTALIANRHWNGSALTASIKNPDQTEEETKKKPDEKDQQKGDEKDKKKGDSPKDEPKPKPAIKFVEGAGATEKTEKPPGDKPALPPVVTSETRTEAEPLPRAEGPPTALPPILAESSANSPALPDLNPGRSAELPPTTGPDAVQLPAIAGQTTPNLPPTPDPAPTQAPAPPADLPAVPVVEAKAPATELNPTPPAGLPAVPPETVATPVAQPTPPVNPPTAPVRAEAPPTLETIPTASAPAPIEPAATTASMGGTSNAGATSAAALGSGWVVIQSGGRRTPGAGPIVSTPTDNSDVVRTEPVKVADGPRPGDNLADADQFEPVLHTVRPGENFWTISKLYYKSGRYYKALHAANAKEVPEITKLYVGTVLRIPPPEKLDRSLVDRETAPVTRTTTKKAEPTDLADLAPSVRPRMTRPDPEVAETPRRPTYKVKPYDTLRKIARETLDDSKRDLEIFNLNRDVLDDPKELPAGTVLTLPEDAKVGRAGR